MLNELTDPLDISRIPIPETARFGEWVVGFGWDDFKFASKQGLHRSTLDQMFIDVPVSLSRSGGHASLGQLSGLDKSWTS